MLWDPVGGLRDLNALMGFEPGAANQFPLAQAVDVNNLGQIVGFGLQAGWLLTPVSVPAGRVAAIIMVAWARLARRRRGGGV